LIPAHTRISIEKLLIRPEGRPPGYLAVSLIALLKAERDATALNAMASRFGSVVLDGILKGYGGPADLPFEQSSKF
jgi:hypothetical protein